MLRIEWIINEFLYTFIVHIVQRSVPKMITFTNRQIHYKSYTAQNVVIEPFEGWDFIVYQPSFMIN